MMTLRREAKVIFLIAFRSFVAARENIVDSFDGQQKHPNEKIALDQVEINEGGVVIQSAASERKTTDSALGLRGLFGNDVEDKSHRQMQDVRECVLDPDSTIVSDFFVFEADIAVIQETVEELPSQASTDLFLSEYKKIVFGHFNDICKDAEIDIINISVRSTSIEEVSTDMGRRQLQEGDRLLQRRTQAWVYDIVASGSSSRPPMVDLKENHSNALEGFTEVERRLLAHDHRKTYYKTNPLPTPMEEEFFSFVERDFVEALRASYDPFFANVERIAANVIKVTFPTESPTNFPTSPPIIQTTEKPYTYSNSYWHSKWGQYPKNNLFHKEEDKVEKLYKPGE